MPIYNDAVMIQDILRSAFASALNAAADERGRRLPHDVQLTFGVPKSEDMGDYSCNIAMILAKRLGVNPKQLADAIEVVPPAHDNPDAIEDKQA